jgi:hypothetical protein
LNSGGPASGSPACLLERDEMRSVKSELATGDHVDDLDDEERARLHASLAESLEQAKRGELIDGKPALAEILAYDGRRDGAE